MFAAPDWAGDDSYLETAVIAIFGGVSLFVIPPCVTTLVMSQTKYKITFLAKVPWKIKFGV